MLPARLADAGQLPGQGQLAKRDALVGLRTKIEADGAVKTVLQQRRSALKKRFDAAASSSSRMLFGKAVASMDTITQEFFDRRLARDVTVLPVPAVTGSTAQPVHSNLAAIEVKAAFVTCQRGDGGDEGNATIDFDEFLVCLALCGHIKYEEVEDLPPQYDATTMETAIQEPAVTVAMPEEPSVEEGARK